MSFIKNLYLYLYKVLFLCFFFPIGGMLITSVFDYSLISSILFGFCLILISVMKFKEFLKDPDFDFNTFVFVILIIPIIIDFGFKLTYENFYFFNNMGFAHDILIKYLYQFYDNYMKFLFINLFSLDINTKKFYIEGIAFFILIKYCISQVLNYFWLDYMFISYYLYKIVFK